LHEFDFTKAVKEHGAARLVFVAGLYDGEECVSRQTALFAKEKDMTLPNPELHWDVTQEDDRLVISLTANAFARYVELKLAGADVVFSDNYFDVPAGWTVSVSAPIPAGWSLDQVKQALRFQSLCDSF
jgi:beta-mannosidase